MPHVEEKGISNRRYRIEFGAGFLWVDVAQFVAHAQELGWLLFSIVIIATVLRMLGSGIRCLRVFNNHALTLTDAISGYTLSAYGSFYLRPLVVMHCVWFISPKEHKKRRPRPPLWLWQNARLVW